MAGDADVTPARGWHPDDYYRASRQARAAWQSQDQQLTLGELEAAQPRALRSLEPAPTAPSPEVAGGLTTSATEPRCEPLLRLAPPDGIGPVSLRPHQPPAGASVALLHRLLLGGIREW